MLSAVITALLFCVMFSIVASLVVGALREHRRHKRALATQPFSPHPLDRHVTAVLHMQDGMIVSVEKPAPPPVFTLSSAWYTRRRTLVSLGFLLMVLLTLFVQDGLAGDALRNLSQSLSFNFLTNNNVQGIDLQTAPHPLPNTASSRVVRIDSGMSNQYYTDYQRHVWIYSSCSGIAMETVMNAYGRHMIAADVLQEELKLGVWSPQMGLLNDQGIVMTANTFSFNGSFSYTRTVQDIVISANKGFPVIVGMRDSQFWPNGHILVVRGGDSQYVYLADSSPANFSRMTYAMFTPIWKNDRGMSVILTPR